MESEPSRTERDPTQPLAPPRFLAPLLGRRRTLVVDARYQLRETLARGTAEEAELLESLADRIEAAKGEEETASIGADLRDQAARKRTRLGR